MLNEWKQTFTLGQRIVHVLVGTILTALLIVGWRAVLLCLACVTALFLLITLCQAVHWSVQRGIEREFYEWWWK